MHPDCYRLLLVFYMATPCHTTESVGDQNKDHEVNGNEKQYLLLNNDQEKQEYKEDGKSNSVAFVVAVAFLFRFFIAVSKICTQALQNRVPAFQFNTIRCFFFVVISSVSMIIRKESPLIDQENIKPTTLWSFNQNLLTLGGNISIVYLPFSSSESTTISFNILVTVFVYLLILKGQVTWSQVRELYLLPRGMGPH